VGGGNKQHHNGDNTKTPPVKCGGDEKVPRARYLRENGGGKSGRDFGGPGGCVSKTRQGVYQTLGVGNRKNGSLVFVVWGGGEGKRGHTPAPKNPKGVWGGSKTHTPNNTTQRQQKKNVGGGGGWKRGGKKDTTSVGVSK